MKNRIATAILLATCPFATALADTKVVLPHYHRFADTGRDFLLKTTVILRFTSDANRYLNNTAAIQELVKGALEATIIRS